MSIQATNRHCRWCLAALLGLAALISASFVPQLASAKEKKVLVIGIDGTRFDALKTAETPNLDRLMEEGCYDEDCQILGDRYQGNDTISGPGWSSILTGVWADKHGVNDNSFDGRNYDEFPHFFSRLKQVRPDAPTASVVTWVPIQTYIVRDADQGKAVTPPDNDYIVADAKAAEIAATILSDEDPTATFFYIGQVDETGHKVGFHPSVKEYIAAIERADGLVGQVIEAIRSRKTYADEDWLVLVTSDHGGQGLGHGGGHKIPEILNSFMIASGPSAMHGKLDQVTYLVDVPVTALAHLGVKSDDAWKLDGRPVGLKQAAGASADATSGK